jgi:hypothetical protein
LKENFIGGLKEVFMREDSGLMSEGQEYLDKKKKTCVKITDAGNIKWDFGSGNYQVLADQHKESQKQNDSKIGKKKDVKKE